MFFAIAVSSIAQQQSDTIKKSVDLDELVVSAYKTEELKRNIASQINIILSKQIKFDNPQTTADIIANTGQIMVQKSQQGGGSPVIRGFEANKILLVVDGVRMNNLIYRGGHLQNIITIDPNIIEKIEILFGNGSTIYGSDALGGSIHFITRKPDYRNSNNNETDFSFMQRFCTVNHGKTSNLNFTLRFKKIATLSSISYNKFGDLKMGKNKNPFYDTLFGLRNFYVQRINDKDSVLSNNDKYLQTRSDYSQMDLLQKILVKQNEKIEHIFNIQYSNSSNIQRYDRLSEKKGDKPRFSEWYYGPQSRFLASYYLVYKKFFCFDVLNVVLSRQKLSESRINRLYESNNLDTRLEDVFVSSINADFLKNAGKHKLRFGYEAQFNSVFSSAKRDNILTEITSPLDSRYPDGDNTLHHNSLYFTHTYHLSSKFIFNEGIRLGYSILKSEIKDNSFFNLPVTSIKQKNFIRSAFAGVVFNPKSNLKISYSISSGYRVPNIDDLSKIFESSQGIVLIPNANLKPEYTISNELGSSYKPNKNIRIESTVFYTSYFNAIVTGASSLNGKDSIVYNGIMSKIFSSQNAQNAYIYGVYIGINANVIKNLQIYGNFSYTKGRITSINPQIPLDHISPIIANAGVSYNYKKITSELIINFNGKKTLNQYSNSGEDNLQYATKQGTPAWIISTLRFAYRFNKKIVLQTGCENIFDTNYRVFASGINAPGRNFYFTFRYN